MTRTHSGTRLRLGSGEATGRTRIRDLTVTAFHDPAHFVQRYDSLFIEFNFEETRCGLGRLARYRATLFFPAVKAAIEDVDLLCAHSPQHPPNARRREHSRPVIDNDRVLLVDAHGTCELTKQTGPGKCMWKRALRIDDLVLVEE